MITISWWQLLIVFSLIFLAGMGFEAFLRYYKSLGSHDAGNV